MDVVLGQVEVLPGMQATWDRDWVARAEGARQFPGWEGAELLTPASGENGRLIVGWWRDRGDFEHWRKSAAWRESEQGLRAMQSSDPVIRWYTLTRRVQNRLDGLIDEPGRSEAAGPR
jgi:heme-degrading monooxygenase HmoA